jgi:hypothetical protein
MTAYEEETLMDKIKALSELEFSAILKQMAEHLRRNKWEHIIDDCFDIETYESELGDANDEISELKEKLSSERATLNKIRELI